MYIFQLMDYYSASGMPLLWVCFFQTVAISWIFGVEKLADCIEQMMGMRPNKFWTVCWKYIAPIVMIVRLKILFPLRLIANTDDFQAIFLSQCIQYVNLKYADYEYPAWAEIFGFCLSTSSMMWVPLYAIYFVWSGPGSLLEVWSCSIVVWFYKIGCLSIHFF